MGPCVSACLVNITAFTLDYLKSLRRYSFSLPGRGPFFFLPDQNKEIISLTLEDSVSLQGKSWAGLLASSLKRSGFS